MNIFKTLIGWFHQNRRTEPPYKPQDLVYGLDWCQCGAQMAYVPHMAAGGHGDCNQIYCQCHRMWDCSAILLGVATPKNQPGSVEHSDAKPFVFWEIKTNHRPARGDDHLPVWSHNGTAPDPFANQRTKESPS